MAEEGPLAKKMKMTRDDGGVIVKEEVKEKFPEIDGTANVSIKSPAEGEESVTKDSQERLRQQNEASRRENLLVMRLAAKEQEMQDYMNQIQELKQSQNLSTAQLRSMLLDPAINLMFQRMRKEVEDCKQKLEQAQNDLTAWKFTPDSQTGKRLMAKCRMLLQENEDLGKSISSGRTAKLEGEIALEKTLVQEMKKSQNEMDEFMVELDDDMEGMQSTIYLLQQQLKDSREQITQLQEENARLREQNVTSSAGFVDNSSHQQQTAVDSQKSQSTTNTPHSHHKQNTNQKHQPEQTGSDRIHRLENRTEPQHGDHVHNTAATTDNSKTCSPSKQTASNTNSTNNTTANGSSHMDTSDSLSEEAKVQQHSRTHHKNKRTACNKVSNIKANSSPRSSSSSSSTSSSSSDNADDEEGTEKDFTTEKTVERTSVGDNKQAERTVLHNGLYDSQGEETAKAGDN